MEKTIGARVWYSTEISSTLKYIGARTIGFIQAPFNTPIPVLVWTFGKEQRCEFPLRKSIILGLWKQCGCMSISIGENYSS